MRHLALFLLVAIPSIILFPVFSQTLTTITNSTTLTALATGNSNATNTLGLTTLSLIQVLRGTAIIGVPVRQGYTVSTQCIVTYNVTLHAGIAELTGIIGPAIGSDANNQIGSTFTQRNVPFNFYIMNDEQYADFAKYMSNHDCSTAVTFGIVHELVTTTYSLEWKNPTSGLYYLIFQNYQNPLPAGVYDYTTTLNGRAYTTSETAFFNRVTIPFIIQVSFKNAVTSTMYTVVPSPVTFTSTQTQISLQVTQASTAGGFYDLPILIVMIVVLVVIVVIGILLLKRSVIKTSIASAQRKTDH